MMKTYKVSIAGIGNVGMHVVENLSQNKEFISKKTNIKFEIVGISANDKNKKRICDINKFKWYDDPLDLITDSNSDIFIELIGHNNGISYELIKNALKNKLHVVTANKALLAKHGNELFKLADENQVLLLFEAAVAGGIPIIRVLKNSLFLNKIKKISGILNGTTNYILSAMNNTNIDFDTVLQEAQKKGFAESNPENDIEGIDSAHKLTLLSVLCFGIKFNFDDIVYHGISNIDNQDIIFAKQLGYKIKLISSAEIKNNKIISIVEPTLVKNSSKLANVDGVQNGIKIEIDNLNSLFIEGEGAGGKVTASSIISDLMEIAKGSNINSLGYETRQLRKVEAIHYEKRMCSYYLRIVVKDLPGVLAKITSNLNEEDISIETILQLPNNITTESNLNVPIIITTHETTYHLLKKVLMNIQNFDFVVSKIVIISIDKTII